MAPSFPELLSSPQFTFFVGEERAPVVAHAQVMASLSKPFDRLINGSMRESEEKCAALPEVEKNIFLRLVEFAYRSDYTISSYPNETPTSEDSEAMEVEDEEDEYMSDDDEEDSTDDEEEEENVEEDAEEDDTDATKLRELAGKPLDEIIGEFESMKSESLFELFIEKSYTLTLRTSHAENTVAVDYSAHRIGDSDRGHKAIFLLNARMYCLAHYYMIPPLKYLALYKLHEALKLCMHPDFLATPERIDDIVALVDFAYSSENTQDRDTNTARDALREEVLEYVIVHIDALGTTPAFQELLAGQGQLAADLIVQFSKERRGEKNRTEAAPKYYSGKHLALAWKNMENE
ncbi:hypothetical protein BKA58DRAFT_96730 [Alternaria rosae]|uniref:uncharacterized protein n=1 Tax=Alternaria rosae TaxID=1187941 RepID=UPI001E8D8D45|nr:uncharacterized protein BKA58DRAFT_96730 [Alternaria rosae]KAH6878494.1 hypothetical protein BKA58DRAFT_96730 [Alternaria rosae]